MHCRSKALAENNLAIKIFFLSILLKAKKRMDHQSIRTSSWQMIFWREGKTLAIEIKLMKVNSYLAWGIFPWEPHYWIIQLKPLQFFIFHGKLPKQLAPCAVTMAWISVGWELCLSLCLHLCLCLSLWLSLHLSVFSLVFVCVTVAWISARWERAPRENWSCLHSLRERGRVVATFQLQPVFYFLNRVSAVRWWASHASVLRDVITVQSTNEYSLIQPPIMQIFKWN